MQGCVKKGNQAHSADRRDASPHLLLAFLRLVDACPPLEETLWVSRFLDAAECKATVMDPPPNWPVTNGMAEHLVREFTILLDPSVSVIDIYCRAAILDRDDMNETSMLS